jgi:hypothetical protein
MVPPTDPPPADRDRLRAALAAPGARANAASDHAAQEEARVRRGAAQKNAPRLRRRLDVVAFDRLRGRRGCGEHDQEQRAECLFHTCL